MSVDRHTTTIASLVLAWCFHLEFGPQAPTASAAYDLSLLSTYSCVLDTIFIIAEYIFCFNWKEIKV